MSIVDAPQSLDEASVLSVAPASAGQIGFDHENGEPVAVLYQSLRTDLPRAVA